MSWASCPRLTYRKGLSHSPSIENDYLGRLVAHITAIVLRIDYFSHDISCLKIFYSAVLAVRCNLPKTPVISAWPFG
jgi:hypothetical protein